MSSIGYLDEALEASQQAVGIWRMLAAEHPAAFNPALGSSLNTFADCSFIIGRQGEAVEAVQQAVEIWQMLVTEHPAAFKPSSCLIPSQSRWIFVSHGLT